MIDLRATCRLGTSRRPDRRACWSSGDFWKGATRMVARASRGRTKRHPSASRKPIREGAAKLARRLAEVHALRKLVQKAEAARLYW